MATSNRIINPAVPNLPLGTDEYERRYQDQFTNILRLYFNQLRNSLADLLSNAGGRYISFPYGAFFRLYVPNNHSQYSYADGARYHRLF